MDPKTPLEDDTERQANAVNTPSPEVPEDGSLRGWAVVGGSWLAMFCTFGYANSWGVFQAYYQSDGYPQQGASAISWIGSLQLFLQFSVGAFAGPLYDRGYFRWLILAGSVLLIVCMFLVSLCKAYWQVLLCQGIGIGIGIGLVYLPSISIISQYFSKRRALAIGIALTGSSGGGIVFPIMLNNLIISHGFKKAVQYQGYLVLGFLILSNLLMRPRPVPKERQTTTAVAIPTSSVKKIITEKPYALLVMSICLITWGFFFPPFFLQLFAKQNNIDPNIVKYIIAILNAGSVVGRIIPNFLADRFGPINILTIMCSAAGIVVFAIFGASSLAGLIIVTVLFGICQGAYASLIPPAIMRTSRNHTDIGKRMGINFLCVSIPALTGSPITGALLDRFGYYAPITFSGVVILAGSVCLLGTRYLQSRVVGTNRV